MTPREKALDAALREVLGVYCVSSACPSIRTIHTTLYAALATPSDDWQPTPLADPPGTAVIEDGDWVMTRSGCVLGPIRESRGWWNWDYSNWLFNGSFNGLDRHPLDITHVRKAAPNA